MDPCWLSLRASNNRPILFEGITWARSQTEDQVVKQLELVVAHGPGNPVVPVVLGMKILKNLNLPCLLSKFEHSGWRV